MSKSRRLRRLVPDEALLERRAAGEPLRRLAADYGVAHTTLVRYFRRRDVALELAHARRARREWRAKELRQERELRKRARDEAEGDRLWEEWTPSERPPRHSAEAAWVDQKRDQQASPPGCHSRELYSESDRKAQKAVAAGGGVQEVIEATGRRTLEDVYLLDAQTIVRALDNDARRTSELPPETSRLRRLAPDSKLMCRRAAGETLRSIAADYDVAHTTLSHYFRRPEIAKQLRAEQRRQRRDRRRPKATRSFRRLVARSRSEIREIRCPVHGRRNAVRAELQPNGEFHLQVTSCCKIAAADLRWRIAYMRDRQGMPVRMLEDEAPGESLPSR